jgi:hypothetical protein
MGFVWDPVGAKWDDMFAELKAYEKRFGHCKVPYRWPENHKLGSWVGTQRTRARNGRMTDERRRRLEEIGFRF